MSGIITPLEGKYVCFRVGRCRYGVAIERVARIIRHEEIIEVPCAPRCLRGVIHQRGEVIPIIDIRLRIRLPGEEPSRRRRIIIVRNQDQSYGLLVDEVKDIVEVSAEVADREVASGCGLSADMVAGVARIGDDPLILLDIARVISIEETGE